LVDPAVTTCETIGDLKGFANKHLAVYGYITNNLIKVDSIPTSANACSNKSSASCPVNLIAVHCCEFCRGGAAEEEEISFAQDDRGEAQNQMWIDEATGQNWTVTAGVFMEAL
jgi:hypothetical protein